MESSNNSNLSLFSAQEEQETFTFERMIESIREVCMFYGMSFSEANSDFWECSIKDAKAYIKAKEDRELYDQRNKAYMDYTQANTLASFISIIMGSKQEAPSLDKLYPYLYKDKEKNKVDNANSGGEIHYIDVEEHNNHAQEVIAKVKQEIEKARWTKMCENYKQEGE